MNFLDLFGTSNLLESLSELKNSDGVVINKLDFTKKEDLDKLVEAVDTFKNADSGLLGMVKTFVGDSLNDTLDSVVKTAQQEYAKAHKDDKIKSSKTVLHGTVTPRKEIDKSVMKQCVPTRPSEKTPEEMQKQLTKLVADYISEKIKPTANLTDEQIDSIGDGLFEFACWIYNR